MIHAARILAGLAGVALVATLPAAVRAQERIHDVEVRRSGEIRKDYARCMYNGNRTKADQILTRSDPIAIDLPSLGLTDRTMKRELSMSTCFSRILSHVAIESSMFFNPAQLRAMLAEEAYLAKFGQAPTLPAGAVEPVQRTFVASGGELVNAHANAAFADCVVFNDPARADAVLRTMPGTTEERVAARALAPTLGACLQQGQQMELKADNIRTLVADGLWTRFVRPAGTPPAVVQTGG